MKLVIASRTRTPDWDLADDHQLKEWQNFLDCHDGKQAPDAQRLIQYNHDVWPMTLHVHTRLKTTDKSPLEFLQKQESRTEPDEWTFRTAETNAYDIAPSLDIRHLNKEVKGWIETLKGVVWLVLTNKNPEDQYSWDSPGADVTCQPEMILPLVHTVSECCSCHFIY